MLTEIDSGAKGMNNSAIAVFEKSTLAVFLVCAVCAPVGAQISTIQINRNAVLYAEASIGKQDENSIPEEESAYNTDSEEPKAPQDFDKRLQQRKISRYASIDRALFNRSMDAGYSFNYRSQSGSFPIRSIRHGLSLSTGLTESTGVALSTSKSRSSVVDNFGAVAENVDAFSDFQNTISFNARLLPETLRAPELVLGLVYGQARQNGFTQRFKGISFSTSRTLESASLFTNLDWTQFDAEGASLGNERSLGASYVLTINHRLAAGVGFQLSKADRQLSVPSANTTVVYRAWPEWVLRFNAAQFYGAIPETELGIEVTRTFQP